MSAVYSIRMAAGAQTAPSTEDLVTVPDGFVWIVRDIEARTDGGSDVSSVYFHIITVNPAGDAPIWGLGQQDLTPWAQWQGRAVMRAGEKIILQVAGSGTLRYAINGYQLIA